MSGHSGYPEGSPQAAEAAAFAASHPRSAEWPHMADWNGGITAEQLRSLPFCMAVCMMYLYINE